MMKVLVLALTAWCCAASPLSSQPGSGFPPEFISAIVAATDYDQETIRTMMHYIMGRSPLTAQEAPKDKPQAFASTAGFNHQDSFAHFVSSMKVTAPPSPQAPAASPSDSGNFMSTVQASSEPQKDLQSQTATNPPVFNHHSSFTDFVSHITPAGPQTPEKTGNTNVNPGSPAQFMPFRTATAPVMKPTVEQPVATPQQTAKPSSSESVPVEGFYAQDLSGQYAFRHLGGSHNRFQGQDSQGRIAYGHWGGPSNKFEVKDAQGRTVGMFSYVNPNGDVETRMYLADAESGFRVAGSDLFDVPSE